MLQQNKMNNSVRNRNQKQCDNIELNLDSFNHHILPQVAEEIGLLKKVMKMDNRTVSFAWWYYLDVQFCPTK